MHERSNLIETGDNPDLNDERRQASFPISRLSEIIYGGAEALKRRRNALAKVDADPVLNSLEMQIPIELLDRIDQLDRIALQHTRIVHHAGGIAHLDINARDEQSDYYVHISNLEGGPFRVHSIMFVPTLHGQGTDEQRRKWLPLAQYGAIIGTYAQTELGHGTNIKALETTATFHSANGGSFLLNSPTLTSIKWWPGGLGKSANHCVVIANLIINNRNHGPHGFIVQIRDLDTHIPLPGVVVGEIGFKIGNNTMDNGFLKFENVRVPLDQMLARYAQVSPNGEYKRIGHDKIGYATMLFVRSVVVREQGTLLAQAATIAVRYSCVRRQGEIKAGAGEVKLLDYQTQQQRLLPQLAKSFAFIFAGDAIVKMYNKLQSEISNNNFDSLPELHALSSGLKALCSFETAQGIEQCRLACGGHGYSEASGIPRIQTTQLGVCTYEGDNIVLLLQLARFLMKAAEAAKSNKRLGTFTAYFTKSEKNREFKLDDIDSVIEAFERVAKDQVFTIFDRLAQLKASGVVPELAWNQCSIDLCRAARAAALSTVTDASTQAIVQLLLNLFTTQMVMDRAAELLSTRGTRFNTTNLTDCRVNYNKFLGQLRPEAVAIVDAFDVPDRQLRSVLGRRDGNVYTALYNWAKQSKLNQTEVLPSFHKYLKPMMDRARAKL